MGKGVGGGAWGGLLFSAALCAACGQSGTIDPSGRTSASGSSGTSSGGASSGEGTAGSSNASAGSSSGGAPCGSGPLTLDGLIVTSPLKLSASVVAIGETLSGTITLCNPTGSAITLKSTDIAARPPGGTDSGGPYGDLYDGTGVTIGAGQSHVVTGGRAFTSSDVLGAWYAYFTLQDDAGNYDGDSADTDNKVSFMVVAAGETSAGAGTTGGTTGVSSAAGGSTGSGGASTGASGGSSDGSTSGGTAPSGLHVVWGGTNGGGLIADGNGQTVHLHGVDRSGTEFACTFQSGGAEDAGFPGFFDGLNDQAGVDNMLAWNINAVRVPLNEDCWLGINGYPDGDTAAHYQSAIVSWVNLLNQNGMVVVLDLHWAAPGTEATSTTLGQLPMADADHAPAFWTSVATTFADNSSVIFDLFNEPYITDWSCWVSGAPASANCAQDKNGTAYAVAGMATLLQAVRNAGADNVVILGGLGYSSDFSSWVQAVGSIPNLPTPLDGLSLDNVAASWHAYDFGSEQTGCPSQYNGYNSTCNSALVTAANTSITDVLDAGFPVVMGESGISAYSSASASPFSAAQLTELETWYDGLLTWMEGQDQNYFAWSWNIDTDPVLISDDTTSTPTPYFGVTYQAHLQSF